MTMSDIETIKHLDFDIKDEESCDGSASYRHGTKVRVGGKDCDEPARVHAIRKCCGHIDTLCLECYNSIVSLRIATNCKFCSNPKHVGVYSHVDFIK